MADDPYVAKPPHESDLRFDDSEFDPAVEPRKSLAWINLLEESEKAFESWNDHCDNIDRLYANLERLSDATRDKQFAMFWANCEVLKPAIYARPPVPVVVPKFKDRRPVYQQSSELLERCNVVAFDLTRINDLMLQVRDDLALTGRGVAWVRYESGKQNGSYYGKSERICVDFKHRRDFLHSLSRCWYEVSWVAAASYLTRSEARERFYEYSGDAYQEAEYRVDRESKEVGGGDDRERAKFWEIWHKGERRVVWVAKGCEDILDEDDPHLDLEGFFPCPCPAYGTRQRGSLVPVPDAMQYKDQLDEVNVLTAKIHALSECLEARGFYPAGSSELSDAVESAVKMNTPGRILVPISDWAAFGGSKDVIVWLPIDMIATTITSCVEVRKQVIDDIYQIMGLSDIERGATDPRETLGAQELKSQFGSARVRDKQNELVRLARDVVQINSDIMCEKFKPETLIEMSQTTLPTQQMQLRKVQKLQAQLQAMQMQAQQMSLPPPAPQGQPMMPGNSDQGQMQGIAQQQTQALQDQIEQAAHEVTIEQVLTFLHDNRSRSFVLDIETDSTIIPDENGEKQRRTEFIGMLSNLIPQLVQFMAAAPQSADFCSEVLKFSVAPFRAGRTLDGAIDDLAERMKQKAQGPQPDDPTTATNKTAIQIEQIKQATADKKNQGDLALKAQEIQLKNQQEQAKIASNEKMKLAELMAKQRDEQGKAQLQNQKAMHDREAHQADMIGKQFDMQLNAQKMGMAQQAAQARQADMASRASERQAAQAFRQQQQPPQPFQP